jgi:hypothetical protein
MKTFAAKLLLAVMAVTAVSPNASLSQVTGDEEGQEIYSYQDGDKLIHQISSPHVKDRITNYKIRFQEGDRIKVEAGGCVQTGGFGKTWKRYVDPSGLDSGLLYHGLIGLPYLLRSYPESPTVNGLVRIEHLIGKEYLVPSIKADSPESFYLRLGYEDDGYGDNGYTGHDDGTEDQCRRTGNAWVKITVTRKFPPRPSTSLAGNWNYTAVSNVAKTTYEGTIVLAVIGNRITGTMTTPDGSKGAVSGTYDPANGILSLFRDTRLQTVQKYALKSTGNKFIGQYWNVGIHMDSGSFKLWKSTL